MHQTQADTEFGFWAFGRNTSSRKPKFGVQPLIDSLIDESSCVVREHQHLISLLEQGLVASSNQIFASTGGAATAALASAVAAIAAKGAPPPVVWGVAPSSLLCTLCKSCKSRRNTWEPRYRKERSVENRFGQPGFHDNIAGQWDNYRHVQRVSLR